MALLPLTVKRFVVPGGYSVAGFGAAAKQRPGDVAPRRIKRKQMPPGVWGQMYRPLHGGERPYNMTWGPPVKYAWIPRGQEGTRATLKVMKGLVLDKWGHRNPEVVLLAKEIVRDVSPGPTKDYRAMAQAILDFMKGSVTSQAGPWNQAPLAKSKAKYADAGVDYQLDPAGLEWVQTPWYTLLVEGSGDCDDSSVATAALAMALGFGAGFRTVKGDPSRPEQWSHVYPVIGIQENGELVWLTADSTQKESSLGWDPPEGKLYGMKTWPIDPSISDGPRWDS